VLKPTWASRQWRALGSPSELLVYGENAEDVAVEAMAEIERLEACWSRFRPESELSELNRSAGRWFPVSPSLWEALDKARWAFAATKGIFDPTIHDRLVDLGYDRTFREMATTKVEERAPSLAPIGFGAVIFDDEARAVQLPDDRAIDLGGIGKGLAADLITASAIANGATSVCLGLGGDIRVRGPGPDEDAAWKIEIQHPVDNRVLGSFPLIDEALVQSTTLFRRWERSNRTVHHLIDPRTGEPSQTDLVGAVVTGTNAWLAEVVAKSAIMLGSTDGLALLIRSELDGWLLHEDGGVTATAAVENDLERLT
jgi:FAD:protein FMN transferase